MGVAMLHAQQVEELLCLVSRMDRATIARRLTDMRAGFPIDFTPQFIETTDLDRLRHIFLALCLQTHHIPEVDDEVDVVVEHVA
jgi:hypothetical protein